MANPESVSQGFKQELRQSSHLLWKGLTIIAVILSLFSLVLTSSYKSTVTRNSMLAAALQDKVLETEQNLAKVEQDTDKHIRLISKALTDEVQSVRSQAEQQVKTLEAKVNQMNTFVQLQGIYGSIERAHAAILKDGDYAKAADEIEKARNKLSKISEVVAEDQKVNLQKLQQSLHEVTLQLQNPTPSVTKLLGDIMDKLGTDNNTPPTKLETPSSPGIQEKPESQPPQKTEEL